MNSISGFMGHDNRIKREYYRLPKDLLELVKVSKLLIAAKSGRLSQCAGKSLNDINIVAKRKSIYSLHHNS